LKDFRKWFVWLLLLDAVVFIAGYAVRYLSGISFPFGELAVPALSFTFISVVIMVVFFTGLKKDQAARTMHILVAISLKLLLELVLALVWFFIAKKTSYTALFLFFVLYLPFTVFTTFTMFNTLKTKSL
jgi:F0F1-type ATP synthase assembly protein I